MYAKSGGKLRPAGSTGVFAPKGKAGAADAKAPGGGLGQTAQPRAANPVTAGDAAYCLSGTVTASYSGRLRSDV